MRGKLKRLDGVQKIRHRITFLHLFKTGRCSAGLDPLELNGCGKARKFNERGERKKVHEIILWDHAAAFPSEKQRANAKRPISLKSVLFLGFSKGNATFGTSGAAAPFLHASGAAALAALPLAKTLQYVYETAACR